MREDVELTAVRDRDLRPILDRFGLSEGLDKGTLLCASCSQPLTWANLGALLVRDRGLLLFWSLCECSEISASGEA